MSKKTKKVRITQVKSVIGTIRSHRSTIKALGLGRRNSTAERELTPSVQGQIDSISYLLKVEDVKS